MVRFAYLILAAVCWCFAGCDEVKGNDDVLQATVTVNGNIGQGVFVERSDSEGRHVYFLTARHIATYPGLADSPIQLKIGRETDYTLNSQSSRWMTLVTGNVNGIPVEWDLAWYELNNDECEELRGKKALNAIHLDASGTVRLLDCRKRIRQLGVKSIESEIVFLSGPRSAAIQVEVFNICHLSNQFNRRFHEFKCLVAGALCEQTTVDGDSGGAVFIKEDSASTWKLAGLDIGHVNERGTEYTTVCPLDPFLAALRDGTGVRLVDRPEVW